VSYVKPERVRCCDGCGRETGAKAYCARCTGRGSQVSERRGRKLNTGPNIGFGDDVVSDDPDERIEDRDGDRWVFARDPSGKDYHQVPPALSEWGRILWDLSRDAEQ